MRKTSYSWTQATPWGALRISATTDGVHSVRLGAGARRVELEDGAPAQVREIAEAFDRFFAGDCTKLDGIAVDYSGVENEFQRRVLQTLRQRVGPGQTISYGELAEVVGHPGAARAVGTAMARNPVPIVVPCHRVLASGGGLGGYGGGLEMKRALLRLEGAIA
ncbi:MAG: methylated-DNA--[protein]-cysteine S-methyltransferase [Actinomycetota bacterium]